MFLSPKDLLKKRKGHTPIITFASPVTQSLLDAKFIQQNGLDIDCITVLDLSTFPSPPTIGVLSNSIPTASPLTPTGFPLTFNLIKGNTYTFTSSFNVTIPPGMCGWVIGRSTLNRSGVLVRSSLYDTGFNGNIGGTIYCMQDINIEVGARIGQFVMCVAKHASLYEGQYQTPL